MFKAVAMDFDADLVRRGCPDTPMDGSSDDITLSDELSVCRSETVLLSPKLPISAENFISTSSQLVELLNC